MRPLRVLHGPVEVAGVAGAIVQGLRARGHDAELVVMTPPPFGMGADRLVQGYRRRLLEGLKAPLRHDVLHFHFNVTFCEGLDAGWARVVGRPLMVMHFHGDDCRRREVTFARHPARARIFDVSQRNERLTLRRLKSAGRLCDAAIVGDFELLDHVAPFFRAAYLVPLALKASAPAHALPAPQPDGPMVLHAPSDSAIKGTDVIRRALANVGARRPLRPCVVTGISHEEVLRKIVDADVVIDQLNAESVSIFGLEAMAVGRPVLSEFRREMLHPSVRETPMIEITPETVEQQLQALLDDPARRQAAAQQGPEFIAEVHASGPVAAAVELVYEHALARPSGIFVARAGGVEPLSDTRTPVESAMPRRALA